MQQRGFGVYAVVALCVEAFEKLLRLLFIPGVYYGIIVANTTRAEIKTGSG